MVMDGQLELHNVAIGAAVQFDDRIFDGNELQSVAFRDRDSDRYSGVFDNLLSHNTHPRLHRNAGNMFSRDL